MANSRLSNKIYVDSAGSLVAQGPVKVAYIIFTPNAANDAMVLRETASGADAMKLQGDTAKRSMMFDFSARPLVFGNGLYVQSITSGATALIVTTNAGE